MSNLHQDRSTTSRQVPVRAWLQNAWPPLLILIAVAAILLRIPSVAEPLGIDQSLWASAVRGMARGQLLYRDVWEQRPPGIYLVYLAGFRLLGWHTATVAWLDILASAATAVLLYAIARRLSGRTAAALAAALYAVLTMPAWLQKNDGFLERSVCETFFVVCVAAAALCATWLRERVSIVAAVSAGVALGAAIVLKPNAGLYAPAILGWTLLYRTPGGPGEWGARARISGWMIAGSLVAPLLTVWWLWHLGVLGDARVAIVDFNRYYVSEGFTLEGLAFKFKDAIGFRLKTSPDPLWIAGAVGALLIGWDLFRRRAIGPLAGLAVWWGAAAALVIAVNGLRFFPSYFIPPNAPLALLGAWLLMQAGTAPPWRRAVSAVTLAWMVAALVQQSYIPKIVEPARAGLAALRGQISPADYLERFGSYGPPELRPTGASTSRGYSARANAELASYVASRPAPDERIFLFGINGAGVYFLADRLSAHRFLRVNFFVETAFPDPAFRLERVVADLRQSRPTYLIFERLHSDSAMGTAVDRLQENPTIKLLLEAYRFDKQIEDFSLFRLGQE